MDHGQLVSGIHQSTGVQLTLDSSWSQGIGTIQPAVRLEFNDVTRVAFSSIAYYVGLICGASFWGISADFVSLIPSELHESLSLDRNVAICQSPIL